MDRLNSIKLLTYLFNVFLIEKKKKKKRNKLFIEKKNINYKSCSFFFTYNKKEYKNLLSFANL